MFPALVRGLSITAKVKSCRRRVLFSGSAKLSPYLMLSQSVSTCFYKTPKHIRITSEATQHPSIMKLQLLTLAAAFAVSAQAIQTHSLSAINGTVTTSSMTDTASAASQSLESAGTGTGAGVGTGVSTASETASGSTASMTASGSMTTSASISPGSPSQGSQQTGVSPGPGNDASRLGGTIERMALVVFGAVAAIL